MEEGSGGQRRARRWLELWLGRATVADTEEEPARPAGEATEARGSINGQDRGPMSHGGRSEKRACARCGRVLRWALPLCWDCDAAVKKAGAVEQR